MMIQRMKGKSATDEEDLRSRWSQHMDLRPGCLDPEGIEVRPVLGKEGISSLDPSPIVNNATAIFGPLIQNLEALGYDETNLLCMGYDFRITMARMEERDSYFSNLKKEIETCFRMYKKKIVFLGHSQGAIVLHYFFRWLGPSRQYWSDKFIDSVVAAAPTWLGAPEVWRGALIGEKFGLGSFLNKDWKQLLHHYEGLRTVAPVTPSAWDRYPQVFFRGEGKDKEKEKEKEFHLVNFETLEDHFFPHILPITRKAGHSDPIHFNICDRENPRLCPYPVKKMHVVLAVNESTEVGYFMCDHKGTVSLDKKAKGYDVGDGCVIKNGMIWETSETLQKLVDSKGNPLRRSGDGTVPWESLAFARFWRGQIPDLQHTELTDRIHAHLPCDTELFKILLNHAIGVDIDSNDLAVAADENATSDVLWYAGKDDEKGEEVEMKKRDIEGQEQ
eukprot:TRINITY_DN1019_c0_g1_i3.p1 TRINITY_DN1019_c0_g1~~TRINITY_DN1019_c0_g1_i3.p1  ORF type:complete len:445 (+),score=86.72 TRINITY_DN1019_c0_g1_i3:1596-2930(+)